MFKESKFGHFSVLCQTIGPVGTNCYLIYDNKARVAALIDPGWPADTLMARIRKSKLDLKYIFVTHGHIDHYFDIPDIKKNFPDVKLCMHKDDFRDIFTAMQWIKDNYGQEWIDKANSNPETKLYMDFDNHLISVPEIFIEDDQIFDLGKVALKAIYSPGHSPGGICYHYDQVLFSGDVLFYRSVGRTDTQHGSIEDLKRSVMKLYSVLPDSTIVYPGHGQATDIGSEKKDNKYIIEEKE